MYDLTTPAKGIPGAKRIIDSFEDKATADRWVRTDPKPLHGLEELHVRDHDDWLRPVSRYVRSERGTWVVAK